MRYTHLLYLGLLAGVLSACSTVPEDWTSSMQRSGSQAFVHFACSIDGAGHLVLGALSGGLDGVVKGASFSGQGFGEEIGSAAPHEVALAIMGTGLVLGLGAGLGENVYALPSNYKECLENQETIKTDQPLI